MPKPGVMIYFSIRPAMRYLSNEQMGQLFVAILDYAENGISPSFEDPMVGMAWSFIAAGIDKDGEKYSEKVEKKKYAAFCREAQNKNIRALPFDDWKLLSEEERKSLLFDENKPPGLSSDVI